MKPATFFITGTDTGVGKTVLTALLAQVLRADGIAVAALKPVCSGGRDDARLLHAALGGTLTLDEINPWHFRAPVAPLLAARREHRKITSAAVLAAIRAMQKRFDAVLVEGAGGLLSPLAEGLDSRDLLVALHAKPIIVAQNKLGVINHLLLTLEALPVKFRTTARIVLMSPPKPDSATGTNAILLAEFFDTGRIFTLPWLGRRFDSRKVLRDPRVCTTLHRLWQ